jgi:hypothetical protein
LSLGRYEIPDGLGDGPDVAVVSRLGVGRLLWCVSLDRTAHLAEGVAATEGRR